MATTFADLPLRSQTIEALHAHGFLAPFAIQEMVLPIALADGDVIGQAKTGTGKTLAFGIPLVDRVIAPTDEEWKSFEYQDSPQVLVVVPTRELAIQVADDLKLASANRSTLVAAIYGGKSYEGQGAQIDAGAQLIVGTPGRLIDLSNQRKLDLSKIECMVLDEADEMLDLGFLPDVEKLFAFTPAGRQTMLFSATLDGQVANLVRRYMKSPKEISIDSPTDTVGTMRHLFLAVHHMDKDRVINSIATAAGQTVVFCDTKRVCDKVAESLQSLGANASALHGDMPQNARERALGKFEKNELKILVATDVAARGIDIPNMEYVINYDLPDNPENYVHRCGRTGRGNALGQALSFCSQDEIPLLDAIEAYTGEEVLRYEITEGEYKAILFDADDPNYNWQKLLEENSNPDFWED